jgi:glutamyl-tRNA synthetase
LIRGRLAPSPTGALHLGNARTFLLTWLSIRLQGGSVVLRVEDLDGPRVKPAAAAEALADLRWLGLDWDEGPDCGGPYGPYVQTQRGEYYDAALRSLAERHMVYACVCTRSDIERSASAPHAGEEGPRYPGTCRGRFDNESAAQIAAGRAPALRFRAEPGPVAFHDLNLGEQAIDVAAAAGDFVVRKGTGTAAYQLAVVVDDAAMRITEVVRGDDLLLSTPRQLLLYRALGLHPPCFRHLPLVIGPDGLRLAKRHGDTRIALFRAHGIAPERLVGLLAHWSGLAPANTECLPRDLIAQFDWDRVPRHRVVCAGEQAVMRQLADRNEP